MPPSNEQSCEDYNRDCQRKTAGYLRMTGLRRVADKYPIMGFGTGTRD